MWVLESFFSPHSSNLLLLIFSLFLTHQIATSLKIETTGSIYKPTYFEWDSLVLSCGGKADYEQTRIRYLLGETVIFDSKSTADTPYFVIDYKNGRVGLIGKDRPEGFNDLTCERDGVISENHIAIFALNQFEFRVTPNRFQYGNQIQMECLYSFSPEKNYRFNAQMYRKFIENDAGAVSIKIWKMMNFAYDSNDLVNNNGSQESGVDLTDMMELIPGEDTARFYANVTLFSHEKSQGYYYCDLQMDGLSQSSNVWNTYVSESINGETTTTESSTVSTTVEPDGSDPDKPLQFFASKAGYDPADAQTEFVALYCGYSPEYNSSRIVKYMLGKFPFNEVIFDSRTPHTSESFVIDRRNGNPWLKTNNRYQGFEDISCEIDGKKSNSLTIHAVSKYKIKVTPNQFQFGTPMEVECPLIISPTKGAKFQTKIVHISQTNEETALVRFEYDYENGQHYGTVSDDFDGNVWTVILGKDDSRLYATITPLNHYSRGSYKCGIFIRGSLGNYLETSSWNTEGQEVDGPEVTIGSTVSTSTVETEYSSTTEQSPNSAIVFNINLLFFIFVLAFSRLFLY